MPSRILIGLVLIAAATSACATTPSGENRYTAQLDRLAADCRARGGVLTPNGSATTGRPELDYACRITGATRLN
jgi:hypothetical protein